MVDFEGVRQYVQLTATTLVGVAASDGKLLWRYDQASNTHRINCITPVYHDGGCVRLVRLRCRRRRGKAQQGCHWCNHGK